MRLTGQRDGSPQIETFERIDFRWGQNLAVATCRGLFTCLEEIELDGVEKGDRLTVRVMDYAAEDITLLLPLWAGTPTSERAADLLADCLLAPARFGRPFGMPACPDPDLSSGRRQSVEGLAELERVGNAVHLPWNVLVAEGLLNYGMRPEAAQMCYRLMAGVIRNLKKQRAFSSAYHALTGAGMGERNSLAGLAPVGLFLEILGVRNQVAPAGCIKWKEPLSLASYGKI